MEARAGGGARHHNNHHRQGDYSNNRRFQHGSGGRGRGGGRGFNGGGGHSNHHHHHNNQQHPGGRGSFWFKGEGYNDFEAVSIDEEVVGIHGFLTPEQPGFPGLVKQRYSDFIVHELGTNGQPVTLTTLVAKKRTIQAHFTELVTAFAYGNGGGSGSAADEQIPQQLQPVAAATIDEQKLIRHLARDIAQRATARSKCAQEALESYNQHKLVELVARELGTKMGGEFAAFLDKVKTRKQLVADARAKSGGGSDTTTVSMDYDTSGLGLAGLGLAGFGPEKLEFYIGGFNEKRDRVFIHETMRRYGKSVIVADTITSPDQSQVIRIREAVTVSGLPRKGERDPRRDWPVDRPDFVQFVVYKRNKDLVAVVNQIASVLKVNPALFSYADVKDKRGITSQLCTVYRVAKEKFQAFVRQSSTSAGGTGRSIEDQSYLVGDLKYTNKKLTVGDCKGNAFSIVLRGIPSSAELTKRVVEDAVTQWENRGFTNFFGIQRFGSSATPHHIVGRSLLRKDFKLAVLLLLRPQEGEASKVRHAREHFKQHKDVAAALRMLPPFLIPERAVLEGLLQHGMDANEAAFRNIPVHLRLAYTESYQHYVWNQMASMRIDLYSRTVAVVGDLVFAPPVQGDDSQEEEQEQGQRRRRRDVITLTAETCSQHSIHEVVLPLPGFAVTYPSNSIGEAYQKLLAMDGVDLASWESKTQSANHHPYDLKGSYRHVVQKPTQVRFELHEYDDATTPLLLNDLDNLQGRTAPYTAAQDHYQQQRSVQVAGEPTEKKQPTAAVVSTATAGPTPSTVTTAGRAMVLHFCLDFGCDATIAVRELLKQSSSVHVQRQLSDQKQDAATAQSRTRNADAGTDAVAAGRMSSKALARGSQPPGLRPSNGGTGGVKRPSTTVLSGGKLKDPKIMAAKKTQVAIGRPGFSLGKSG